MIEALDRLIVNPSIELLGEDKAAILTDLIVHMLDLQLKRQVAVPRSRLPRVSLIIDEALPAARGRSDRAPLVSTVALALPQADVGDPSAPVQSRR